jgi:hypothetical protein
MRRSEARAEKRKKQAMGVFIVLIMTMSVLGYMFGKDTAEQLSYNDFKFNRIGNRWATNIDKTEYVFDFFPSQVDTINVSSDIINSLKESMQIDMTSDINSEFKEAIALAEFELSNYLTFNNQYARIGFTQLNEYEKPMITCIDATMSVPVIIFETSNETKVYTEGNCIIAKSKSDSDFIAIKDRLLFGLIGIIN